MSEPPTMPAPLSEDVVALARASVRTGYVPGPVTNEFRAGVAAGELVRELGTLGSGLVPL
jgi:hypothetical protein